MLAESLTYLRAAYPRAQFPPETVAVYVEELQDLGDEEVVAACRRIARRSMYLPTIAEIRREVVEHELGWPTPGQAWEIAVSGRAFDSSCAPLRDAYRALGGRWAVKHSTNIGPLRHSFERDYDARVEAAVREMVTSDRQAALPSAGRPALAADIPSTPVERRMARRFLGEQLAPPTEEEKSDAIRVLRDDYPSLSPKADAIYVEAERIFAEGAA